MIKAFQNANDNVLQNWSALSSNLNPVEHRWCYLKGSDSTVAKEGSVFIGFMTPAGIRQMGMKSVTKLIDAIRRALRQMPMFCAGLIRSMGRRCRAIVAARGKHTCY